MTGRAMTRREDVSSEKFICFYLYSTIINKHVA
jgi:hypothetical protein